MLQIGSSTATALHVRVFAANEARDVASLSGLDFEVRKDLDGRPVIEVHLTPEKGAGKQPRSKHRPCAVVSPYDRMSRKSSHLMDTQGRTGTTKLLHQRDP